VGGSCQAGRYRLGVLVARLAQVGVEVDEAGRDDEAIGPGLGIDASTSHRLGTHRGRHPPALAPGPDR
jgi:hypothetical protein